MARFPLPSPAVKALQQQLTCVASREAAAHLVTSRAARNLRALRHGLHLTLAYETSTCLVVRSHQVA
mgnify:CR=1 FL=1